MESSRNKKKIRSITSVMVMVLFMTNIMAIPALNNTSNQAYADTHNLRIENVGATSAMQGETSVSVRFEVTNLQNDPFQFDSASLTYSPSNDITVTGNTGSITLDTNGDYSTVSFNLKISKYALTGYRSYNLILYNGATEVLNYTGNGFQLYESLATPDKTSGKYVASVDISHAMSPSGGFEVGSDNAITFEVFNKGNTVIKDAVLSLTLPEGLSIYNDSNSSNMGYLSTATRKKIAFPIFVSDKAESKNYQIDVKLTGLDYSNNEVSTTKSFYVPVNGSGGAGSVKNISIEKINVPNEVDGTKEFILSFYVKNGGSSPAKDLKISVEPEDGILNKSVSVFSEKSIGAGEAKQYSVTLFAKSGEMKNYPIKIKVESSGGASTMQYTGVFVGGDGSGVKTPQLMVSNYSFGGSYVQAGEDFRLNLSLYNTSPKNISNIKVKIDSAEGAFVPAGSSNSFFIESIKAKGRYAESMELSVKRLAEQKTTPITVTMTYEDSSGTTFTAEDVIAIPVMQENRLMVEDIVAPMESYVGQVGSAEVKFYNMGKSTISNLKINAEGNFDVFESNGYYVGNMEAGRSDSYSFSFTPKAEGPFEGKVIFSFEDAAGDPQTLEVPFTFSAMEQPPFVDPGMEEPVKATPWKLIIGLMAAALAIGGFVAYRKIKKNKLHKKMQIEDEEFIANLDLEDK